MVPRPSYSSLIILSIGDVTFGRAVPTWQRIKKNMHEKYQIEDTPRFKTLFKKELHDLVEEELAFREGNFRYGLTDEGKEEKRAIREDTTTLKFLAALKGETYTPPKRAKRVVRRPARVPTRAQRVKRRAQQRQKALDAARVKKVIAKSARE